MVVAAIRHVTTGTYLQQIKEYAALPVVPELEPLQRVLTGMADRYEKLVEAVSSPKDEDWLDFHSRRLVESAGHIIMGHLLLQDANKEPELFRRSAEVYIHYGRTEVEKNFNFVAKSRIEDLGYYKPAVNE